MQIYELNKEIEQLLEQYYNCFDVDTGEQIVEDEELNVIQKQLEEHQNQKDDLKSWILKKRANNVANEVGVDNEINRLKEIKEYYNKQIKKSDNFIEFLFKKTIEDKPVVFDNYKIGYKKSKRVVIENEEKIPNKYKKHIPREVIEEYYKIDKNILKKHLKENGKIEGCDEKTFLNFYIE